MQLIYFGLYFESTILQESDDLDSMQSPEQFLSSLEDKLESGELTVEEVRNLISDYNRNSK